MLNPLHFHGTNTYCASLLVNNNNICVGGAGVRSVTVARAVGSFRQFFVQILNLTMQKANLIMQF